MPDYIPGGDAEFGAWLANFVTYANANLAGRAYRFRQQRPWSETATVTVGA